MRARSSGLDRKQTAAISRHTNAFKINEDVVIPLPRMAEYTDGIERINIELSLRNKLKLCDALTEFFDQRQSAAGASRMRPMTCLPPSCWKTAWPRPRPWWPKCAPSGKTGSTNVATPVPRVAGPPLRASWKTQLRKAPMARHLQRRGLQADAGRSRWLSTSACSRAALGGAAHARGRRQRAHQHPRQQRRLRDAADRARGGGAASWCWPAAWTA